MPRKKKPPAPLVPPAVRDYLREIGARGGKARDRALTPAAKKAIAAQGGRAGRGRPKPRKKGGGAG